MRHNHGTTDASRTSQTKTFDPSDVVGPDPSCPLPKCLDRRSTYRLVANHRMLTVPQKDTPVLRGNRIFDTGRVSPIVTIITWPVVVLRQWDEKMELRDKIAKSDRRKGLMARRQAGERSVFFWGKLAPGAGDPVVGDTVQSMRPQDIRRLWRVTRVELSGPMCLFGRRISWKTGEPIEGREREITAPVVRLVARAGE